MSVLSEQNRRTERPILRMKISNFEKKVQSLENDSSVLSSSVESDDSGFGERSKDPSEVDHVKRMKQDLGVPKGLITCDTNNSCLRLVHEEQKKGPMVLPDLKHVKQERLENNTTEIIENGDVLTNRDASVVKNNGKEELKDPALQKVAVLCSSQTHSDAEEVAKHVKTGTSQSADIKKITDLECLSRTHVTDYKAFYLIVDKGIWNIFMRKNRMIDSVCDFFDDITEAGKLVHVIDRTNAESEKGHIFEEIFFRLPSESRRKYTELEIQRLQGSTIVTPFSSKKAKGQTTSANSVKRELLPLMGPAEADNVTQSGIDQAPELAEIQNDDDDDDDEEEEEEEEEGDTSSEGGAEEPNSDDETEHSHVQVGSRNKANIIMNSYKQWVVNHQHGSVNITNINMVLGDTTSKVVAVVKTNPENSELEDELTQEMAADTEVINVKLLSHGASILAVKKGSIIVELEVKPGQFIDQDWLQSVLETIFSRDHLKTEIPEGTQLEVNVDSTCSVAMGKLGEYLALLQKDIHQNCVPREKYKELQQELVFARQRLGEFLKREISAAKHEEEKLCDQETCSKTDSPKEGLHGMEMKSKTAALQGKADFMDLSFDDEKTDTMSSPGLKATDWKYDSPSPCSSSSSMSSEDSEYNIADLQFLSGDKEESHDEQDDENTETGETSTPGKRNGTVVKVNEPAYLAVGTQVSAKHRGAFYEAKVKKVEPSVKYEVIMTTSLNSFTVSDVEGPLEVGAKVKVTDPESHLMEDAVIQSIIDCSTYTVVFGNGYKKKVQRAHLCLQGDKHFPEYETLDNMPLFHPEDFGATVKRPRKRKAKRSGYPELSEWETDESDLDDTSSVPRKRSSYSNSSLQKMVGQVMVIERRVKQKKQLNPVLVVLPDATRVSLKTKDHLLVRSFCSGKFLHVLKKDLKEFNPDIVIGKKHKNLKSALEKALLYHESQQLPRSWKRKKLLGYDDEDDKITAVTAVAVAGGGPISIDMAREMSHCLDIRSKMANTSKQGEKRFDEDPDVIVTSFTRSGISMDPEPNTELYNRAIKRLKLTEETADVIMAPEQHEGARKDPEQKEKDCLEVDDVMSSEHKTAIQRNREILVKYMVCDDIFNDLVANKILTSADVSRIEEEKTREAMNEELLNILMCRSDKAFHVFVRLLRKTCQEALANHLDPIDLTRRRCLFGPPDVSTIHTALERRKEVEAFRFRKKYSFDVTQEHPVGIEVSPFVWHLSENANVSKPEKILLERSKNRTAVSSLRSLVSYGFVEKKHPETFGSEESRKMTASRVTGSSQD